MRTPKFFMSTVNPETQALVETGEEQENNTFGEQLCKCVVFLLLAGFDECLRFGVNSAHEKLRGSHYCVTAGCKISLVDASPPITHRRPRFFFRAEDLVWLILFTGLAVFNTEKNYPATIILVVMAVFQVAEPKVRGLSSARGQIAASAIKLVLAYLLIGYSDTFESNYFLILFVPVISAATSLGLLGTYVFIVLA